ncbi:MAG: putative OPT family oligopeptide transporter [Myxococcota bacterium]
MATARPYPELSIPAMALGTVIGVIMTAAFTYIALKLGFGLAGSTVAAILGFAVLRGGLRRRSIVENNINQTVASGINTASAGVVFTLPALFLLSVGQPDLAPFPIGPILFAAVAGSVMGIVLIIPLRKQMVEFERLRFPSGVAVATLLRSPGEGMAQAKWLVSGAVVATALTVAVNMGLVAEEVDFGHLAGLPTFIPFAIYISAANFGAGLLSGRGGLPFALGGMLAWWVIAPVAVLAGWLPVPDALPAELATAWQSGAVHGMMLRPLGIGLLIGGALAGVIAALPAIRGALKSLAAAAAAAKESGAAPEELPPWALYGGAIIGFILLVLASYFAAPELGMLRAFGIAVVGALWLALAGVIVAQATGATDISPLSGLSLIAVTLMYFLSGGNITAAIVIGVAVCVAINQCADMMSDLKSGHLVGSIPRKQQLAQLMMCWIGPLVAVGVVYMLWNSGAPGTPGFGSASLACIEGLPGCLPAPQAEALASTIEALSTGDAPVDKYAAGAAIGAAVSVFPIGGLGVLLGLAMYLPFSITLGYGIGCVTSMGLQRGFGKAFIGRKLVPLAAGLIIGEALTQIIWTLYKLGGGS